MPRDHDPNVYYGLWKKLASTRLRGRSFLACERFTTADISVCYSLYLYDMMGLGDQLPNIIADCWRNCTSRESYQKPTVIEAAATTLSL